MLLKTGLVLQGHILKHASLTLQVQEEDRDQDGKPDLLMLQINIPLQPEEQMFSVQLLLTFSYQLFVCIQCTPTRHKSSASLLSVYISLYLSSECLRLWCRRLPLCSIPRLSQDLSSSSAETWSSTSKLLLPTEVCIVCTTWVSAWATHRVMWCFTWCWKPLWLPFMCMKSHINVELHC